MPKNESRSLVADQIYRPSEARHFFGFKPTQLTEKIRLGEIPAPIPLSDSGRAVGWLGSQIIEWQAQRIAAAAKRSVAA
jgi:predicted DNA-binding transcriptional regulator AlpA